MFAVGYVYNAAYYLGVMRTTDDGATWRVDTLPHGTRAWTVAFDPVDPNRVYVGGDSAYSYPALLVSTDLGTTWTQSRSGLTGTINVLAVDPTSPNRIYAGNSTGLFRSTDGGQTWTLSSLNRNIKAVVVNASSPNVLYAGTYGYGVYRSTDYGATWTDFSTGLTNNKVLSLALRSSDGTLLAGTEGGSVFRTGVPTALAEPGLPGVARAGLRIWPNPLTGTGVIDFAPAGPGRFTAAVYDHTGSCVLDLGARDLSANAGLWRFDARNLAAGTYFVRLAGPDGSRTARFVKAD